MNVDFGEFVVRQSVYAPGLRQPRHSHHHCNVTIVVAGQLEESTEAGHYCARPSSVVIKAAGCEHEDRISGFGAKTLTIEFDGTSPLSRSMRPNAWSWCERTDVVRDALGVQRAFDCGNRADLERRAVTLIESAIAADNGGRTGTPRWLNNLRAVLEERFDESLCFEALARDFGLHPVYVARAFRRHFGMSMTDYVRDLRLRRARHLLSSTHRTVEAVAGEAGFSDSSHLCRTFSNLLEVTPRGYRMMTTVKV